MNKQSICKYVSYVYLNNKLQTKMENEEYKRYVENAIRQLPFEQQRIIINEYFNHTSKKDNLWYLEYYSRSTYYRLKNQTIDNFVNLLNSEKML